MNAKEELLNIVGSKPVLAATITIFQNYRKNVKEFLLKQNHSQNDWLHFLEQLNFEYDDGYGLQELFGTVWLDYGTWLERGEYDGSEWWAHRECPVLPEELK